MFTPRTTVTSGRLTVSVLGRTPSGCTTTAGGHAHGVRLPGVRIYLFIYLFIYLLIIQLYIIGLGVYFICVLYGYFMGTIFVCHRRVMFIW